MKIVITDAATLTNGDLDLKRFEKYGEISEYPLTADNEMLSRTADADVILCNKNKITREVIDNAKNLKYIGLFATGYNNVDVKYAREKGIVVCNAPGYSTSAVAQLTFAYILQHYGKIAEYTAYCRDGKWKTSPVFSPFVYPTSELMGKNIGIIGYGSIGRRVADIALAFEMNVYVFTRTPKSDDRVSFVDFDTLLSKCDIVTVHCPLNEKTENLFNADTFGKMKNGAFFINTARGPIVDENALFDALESGKLSGAALDVIEKEPMDKDCILPNAKNLMITPHTAWTPYETRARLLDVVEGNLSAFINGEPKNVVS